MALFYTTYFPPEKYCGVVWRGELYEAVHQYLTPVETPDPDMTTTATAFIGQLVTQAAR